MRVLLITNTFPPTSGSHVQRMLKMANALVEAGIEVGVLTYEINKNHPQYDESFIDLVDKRILVIRAPIGALHKRAYTEFKHETDIHYNKSNSGSKLVGIKGIIYSFASKMKHSLLFPDTMADWYPAVIRNEKRTHEVKSLDPDVIISCSQPNTTHLIGFRLSRMYKKPQFMDYADPWVYLGNYTQLEHTLRFKLGRALERMIIRNSIGYSFSAPGCRDLYVEKYHINPDDTSIAMSGFESRLLKIARDYNNTSLSNKMEFTYGGALQETVRDPKPFFEAVRYFEDRISVTIRTDNIKKTEGWLAECGDSKCVSIKPYLPFDLYFEEMLSSDVILFFGNTNNTQLPGKIFNCIATGKYILYIKSNRIQNDTVEQILNQYGRGIISNNDTSSIRNALDYILDNKNQIRERIDLSSDTIKQFSDRSQYENMVIHLKRIMEDNKL